MRNKQQKYINPFYPNGEPNIDDYYYDAMELLGGGTREIKKALKLLNIALKIDQDYVQTYIGFICAYGTTRDISVKQKRRWLSLTITTIPVAGC